MIGEKQILTERFRKAKNYIKSGNENKARNEADYGLLTIAYLRDNNKINTNDIIEGHTIDFWINRFWVFLEKHGLLLG